ncbi:MAG: hypothetical protein KatS3mg060_3329 [Dehalococcoidia bacterium]|nr:MAG: hypothetical protein KatS3mg060_3329 [Dehalococcoidia bacterium]
MTTTTWRAGPRRLEAQLDEAITDGIARVLRLLTASGEIVWPTEDALVGDARVEEVARLAVALARLPEVEGAPPRSWLPPSVTQRPRPTRTVRRTIRRRNRVARRLPAGKSAWQSARLSRWALALAVASFVVLVVVLAVQRL